MISLAAQHAPGSATLLRPRRHARRLPAGRRRSTRSSDVLPHDVQHGRVPRRRRRDGRAGRRSSSAPPTTSRRRAATRRSTSSSTACSATACSARARTTSASAAPAATRRRSPTPASCSPTCSAKARPSASTSSPGATRPSRSSARSTAASLREFDNRILFQMSAADSSNLIDSPAGQQARLPPRPGLQRGARHDGKVPPVRAPVDGMARGGQGAFRAEGAVGAGGSRIAMFDTPGLTAPDS